MIRRVWHVSEAGGSKRDVSRRLGFVKEGAWSGNVCCAEEGAMLEFAP
jgi:hypothetical protein